MPRQGESIRQIEITKSDDYDGWQMHWSFEEFGSVFGSLIVLSPQHKHVENHLIPAFFLSSRFP